MVEKIDKVYWKNITVLIVSTTYIYLLLQGQPSMIVYALKICRILMTLCGG